MSDIEKQMLQERLDCINEVKQELIVISFNLEKFCMHCNEDRIYCPTCVIPLTKRKLEEVL